MIFRKKINIFIFFIFLLTFFLFTDFGTEKAMAIDEHDSSLRTELLSKYFYGATCSSGSKVLPKGVPGSVETKEDFIEFILGEKTYYVDGTTTPATIPEPSKNYIVRSMLGQASETHNWDDVLTAAEINEWKKRVNASTMVWKPYTYSINTMLCSSKNIQSYQKIVKATGAIQTFTLYALVFYSSGEVRYAVKTDCGNPLGNLPGIPPVPEIPKTYSLSPSITASPKLVSVGGDVTLKSNITYSGDATSPNISWTIDRKIDKGEYASILSGVTGGISSNISLKDQKDNIGNLTVGTEVCYRLGITPHSNDDSGKIYSPPSCVTVSDKPKVRVSGGDLMVGGLVNTSTSTISGSTYGSWDEYGILAGKSISGMASAAAFAGGLSSRRTTQSSYSKLSFNNTNNTNPNCKSSSTIGCYLTSTSLPDIASSFTTTSSTPVLSSGNLTNVSSGIYKTNGNISISASTITKGKWIVINAIGKTVTINGNIKYNDETLHSLSDIPQVIIIADNINISASVTNIDSWLIAKNGYINTCSAVAIGEKLSSNVCNKQLTINGPVVANRLYLRRTYTGTGDTPAEIFNLPEDAYLWSYAHASDNTRIQTVYTTELPPRL